MYIYKHDVDHFAINRQKIIDGSGNEMGISDGEVYDDSQTLYARVIQVVKNIFRNFNYSFTDICLYWYYRYDQNSYACTNELFVGEFVLSRSMYYEWLLKNSLDLSTM